MQPSPKARYANLVVKCTFTDQELKDFSFCNSVVMDSKLLSSIEKLGYAFSNWRETGARETVSGLVDFLAKKGEPWKMPGYTDVDSHIFDVAWTKLYVENVLFWESRAVKDMKAFFMAKNLPFPAELEKME